MPPYSVSPCSQAAVRTHGTTRLDGFEVPPIYPDKVNSTYKITPEDYETISSLSANKSLATTDEEKSALAAIAKNHCFSSEDEARKYLPAFLNSTSSPYYALNNGRLTQHHLRNQCATE